MLSFRPVTILNLYKTYIGYYVKFSVKYNIYADDIMICTLQNNFGLVNKNDTPLSMCANAIHY